MKKKVQNFDDFFRALKTARKRGYEFKVVNTKVPIRSNKGEGFVPSHTIFHEATKGGSLWGPISVVFMAFYQRNNKDAIPSWHSGAGQKIGLSIEDTLELCMAAREAEGCDPELRARMMKACGLVEKPHNKRLKIRFEEYRG